MKKILRRFCAGIMAVVMLVCLFPVSALALSKQEQEDIYRVDTWWQDEYNQQYIDWLLDSDNFLYHLDVTTGNIIHDVSYESLNLDPIERKDNFVKILTAIIDYSYENVREESAQESANALISYFFESFEEYLLKQPDEARQAVEMILDATNLAAQEYLDRVYVIDEDLTQLSYDQMYEYIEKYITQETLHSDALSHFEAFKTSSDWLEKWNAYSTMFSVVGESINIVTDSFDIAVELESYQKTDEKFVELLKYIHSITTDPALKAVCVEIYTKLSNNYEDNFVAEFVERVGEGAVNVTLGILKDCAADANVYVRCITLGYDAGTLVSNWFFNTDDTKKHMQSVYCLNEVAEIIVPVLQNELSNLHYYDSPGEFSAKYAADTIYHMQVLICLRRLGEESYYNLKDSVYSSLMVQAVNVLPWVSSEENEQIIEDWYKQFLSVIDAVEGSLYKMIPAYHYYKKPEPAEFEKEGSRLIAYNGDSVNVYIPTDVYCNTIDSYAFNGNEIIQSVNIPHTIKTISANAFYNCSNLKSVTINSTEAVIADGAFVNCHKDFTIYGYNNSTAQTYAVAHGVNFVSLDSEYENAQDYVDSNFVIEDGVLVDYLGDGGDVYIPYGVTAIGYSAFYDCYGLKSVIIPDSVTSIGSSAFSGCNSLTGITIPDSVVSIDSYAFSGCTLLTTVSIPDSIASVGSNVFEDCPNLTYKTYDNAKYIGNASNPYVVLVKGKSSDITQCQIHTNTKVIAGSAFLWYSGLTNIIIPNSVTSIGESAFSGCDGMTEITISNSVTSIGVWAFGNCSKLIRITIPNSVTSIGSCAFIGCEGLTDIDIPNSVTSIGSGAFSGCNSLTNVTIPDSVVSIGGGAFSGCNSLTNVTIPDSVVSIGGGAFSGCSSLDSITLPFVGDSAKTAMEMYQYPFGYIFGTSSYTGGVETGQSFWISVGSGFGYESYYIPASLKSVTITGGEILYGAFSGCEYLTSVSIGNGITSIGGSAFSGCNSLTSVTIPDSVTNIGDYAFKGCTDLSSVRIGNSVTSIGAEMFFKCKNLTSITIPDSVTCIGRAAFSGCEGLTSVTIGNGVTSIDGAAFYNCTSLAFVTIGNSVTSIGDYAFEGCSAIDAVYITDLAAWCNIDFNDSYSQPLYYAKSLYLNGELATDILIPNGVTHIGNHVFSNAHSLTHVTIPDSVVSIGERAFNNCVSLISITIPDSVGCIGEYAFAGCDAMEGVYITDLAAWCDIDFYNILSQPLYYAKNLYLNTKLVTDLEISNEITVIGDYAFAGCVGLSNITISKSVTQIGSSSFGGCTGLTNITIPDSVTSIGSDAFSWCTGLTNITIPNKVTYIGASAFCGCNSLTSIDIPDNITIIEQNVFSGCESLTSIDIPEGVISIGSDAFQNCTGLTDVAIGNDVTCIDAFAFDNCKNLINVIIPDSVSRIGASAFHNCDSLTGMVIPDSVTSIGDSAFSSCDNLTSVAIGSGVSDIVGDVFWGCSKLSSVTIPYNVTNIDGDVFGSCYDLTIVCGLGSYAEAFARKHNIPVEYFNSANTISISCLPNKLVYPVNGTLNTDGLCLDVVLDDDRKITVTEGYKIGDYDFSAAGAKTVTVTYSGFTVSFEVVVDGSLIEYPESEHPYANDINQTWKYTHPTDASSLKITFSEDTETESYYDCIYIYDGDNNLIGEYSGSELAGQTIEIPGKAFSINLTSDSSVVENGFTITNIEAIVICNHIFGEWVEVIEPTCVATGEEYRCCSECGYEETQTVTELGHDYAIEWTIDTPATCTATGSKSRHCLFCGEKTDITEIPASHIYREVIVDPSCVQDGSATYTCELCSDTYSEILPATHTWSAEWIVDVQETCTSVGSKSHHCLNCEEKTDVTEIPAVHLWSDEWTVDIEPTDTSEGSKSRHCTRCDAKTDVTVIPMLSTESPATDFEYSIRNNEVRITGYVGTSGRMNIPTYIEGYPVTTIAAFAFSGNATITEATIPYTVTNIEYYAFNSCSELLEVNLGSGITVLPESLFSRCGKLQKVSLPTNLTTIQSNAFYYCESLVDMSIPDSVEIIEDSAFYECLWHQSMTEDTVVGTGILLQLNTEFGEDVVIPNGVQTVYACLGEYAFTNTYVDQVTLPASITSWNQVDLDVRASSYVVDEDNKYFTAVDGVIYSKDMSTVVAVPSRMAEELSLPETVTTIGSGALYSSNLSKITLHKGVIELKEGAFSYCSNLTEITIPDSVISIENNAFRGGNDNLVILCGLGSCAAAYATDNNISFRILATPKELSIASLPSKLTYPIGGTLDLSGLSLSAVYEDGTNATVSTGYTVSDYDFSTAGTKVITVSLGELSVAFEVVVDPNLVVYPESDHPYANNSNQTWNYIHPSSADQLVITFSNDTETENNYDKMYIYDGNGNEVGVYSGAQLAGASITVNGNKFSIKLTSDSSVAKNGFTVVSVEAIIRCDHSYGEWIERTAPSCTVDGVEYRTCSVCGNEENQAIAAIGHNWETEWTVDVEPTETSEGSKSRHCINCEATVDVIVIPMLNVSPVEDFVYTVNNSTVTITDYIGTDTTVTIPSSIDGYPVTTIGVYAFADCTDLTRIVIPSSITVVGNWAFSNCTGLTNITIPDSVTYIGIFAFNNCSNLTDITVGNGVVTIGDSAFSNCTSLIRINISRSVANIGNYVFSGCNSLNGIWVDANNPYYSSDDQGVLYNKSKTKLIRAPGGLGSVTIPNSVTNIGISAFSYSNMLSSVVIPSSVASIGEYAFYDCTKLKAVYYCGAKDQWDAVVVSDNNTTLENAVRYIGEISFAGASLSLQHNLAINYKVDKALFEDVGYTDPYVIVELDGEETVLTEYTESGECYVFSFSGAAKDQMVKATLYATYEEALYCSQTEEYNLSDYTAVVVTSASGMEGFAEIGSAIQASSGDGSSYITLQKDVDTDVAVDRDVYLDLNGYSITGAVTVAQDCTLYGMDTKTDDYTVEDGDGYGKISNVNGVVEGVPEEFALVDDGYLKVTEDDGISFHRVNLDLTHMTLRVVVDGVCSPSVYYKSNFMGDELVADAVTQYGVALSVREMPAADNFETACKYSAYENVQGENGQFKPGSIGNTGNGTLLEGIMKTTNAALINHRNANMGVYGRAYIITEDGQYLFGSGCQRTLKQQTEAADVYWNTFSAEQQSALIAMYETYISVMKNWNIPNIISAAA